MVHSAVEVSGSSVDDVVDGDLVELVVVHDVLFLTSGNEILGVIYSLFRGRKTIFLAIFSTKFVVKCATKILKIG